MMLKSCSKSPRESLVLRHFFEAEACQVRVGSPWGFWLSGLFSAFLASAAARAACCTSILPKAPRQALSMNLFGRDKIWKSSAEPNFVHLPCSGRSGTPGTRTSLLNLRASALHVSRS